MSRMMWQYHSLYGNIRMSLSFMSDSMAKTPQVLLFDNESHAKKMKMDSYNLIEAKLTEKDILSAVVSYSGGCEKHEFTLAAVPSFTNTGSNPQTKLVLGHESNGDMCKKIVKETLYFDLKPIKEKYRKVKGLKASSSMLHLMNTSVIIKYNLYPTH
jgi:hypothetical protein